MKVHKYVDGSCFTLKILCPEVKEVAQEQLKRLQGLVEKPMSLDKLHLGLKYLGYETDHEDEYIKSLIPEIKPIVKRYLPLEIEIEGVGAFYDTPEWPSKTIIFLKVKENKRLRAFHDELRTSLKDKVDTFELAEGEYYTPHISIAVGREGCEEELKRVIDESDQRLIIYTVNKFGMRLKEDKLEVIE